jgi:hypothetical protein
MGLGRHPKKENHVSTKSSDWPSIPQVFIQSRISSLAEGNAIRLRSPKQENSYSYPPIIKHGNGTSTVICIDHVPIETSIYSGFNNAMFDDLS